MKLVLILLILTWGIVSPAFAAQQCAFSPPDINQTQQWNTYEKYDHFEVSCSYGGKTFTGLNRTTTGAFIPVEKWVYNGPFGRVSTPLNGQVFESWFEVEYIPIELTVSADCVSEKENKSFIYTKIDRVRRRKSNGDISRFTLASGFNAKLKFEPLGSLSPGVKPPILTCPPPRPPSPPPPPDDDDDEDQDRICNLDCIKNALNSIFPFDIFALPGDLSLVCPALIFFGYKWDLCWAYEILRLLKYPILVSLAIKIWLAL
ncbi:MAG: hypothetical protein RID09_20325 [Coleofasciculus sp. G1-WW12-02]|uniref:hypothetical protein n=1 Tax=Coleofasciculus sp. G1-WW12-02 TaxID=3068483 RepID=UPI0032FA96E8